MNRTNQLMLAAFFAALTAVGAMLSLPLPFTPVPVTLATLACMLAGALAGARCGVMSQVVYILLGVIGLPVFHNFTAGFGIIAGPTGGYLIGYLFIALCSGLMLSGMPSLSRSLAVGILSTLICYFFGTCWFILSTGSSLSAALVSCVIPFIPGDALKIIAAAVLIRRLKTVLNGKVMIK